MLDASEVVSTGQERTFTFTATAPLVPQVYTAYWQMAQGGVRFGEYSTTYVRVVTRCGDGTTDFTEQCDDGNLIAGDGCSAYCQREVAPGCPAFANAPTGTYSLELVDMTDSCSLSAYCSGVSTTGTLTLTANASGGSATAVLDAAAIPGASTSKVLTGTRSGSFLHLTDDYHLTEIDIDLRTASITNLRWSRNGASLVVYSYGTGIFACTAP